VTREMCDDVALEDDQQETKEEKKKDLLGSKKHKGVPKAVETNSLWEMYLRGGAPNPKGGIPIFFFLEKEDTEKEGQ